jgi:hypothetical protein
LNSAMSVAPLKLMEKLTAWVFEPGEVVPVEEAEEPKSEPVVPVVVVPVVPVVEPSAAPISPKGMV